MTEFRPYILSIYIEIFIISLVISSIVVKTVISISRKVKVFDTPDGSRKIHGMAIPSMGGIGIFIPYIIFGYFCTSLCFPSWNLMVVSSAILLFTGIYDDIKNMKPLNKLLIQLIASAITVCYADVRFRSFYGLFGINDIPYWESITITILVCTFFINVFNFIDGIDGLACVLAIIYTAVLGCLFACMSNGRLEMGDEGIANLLFCLTGASTGLLIFNIAPAKIYMGDTGSMLLGFSIFIFCVLFLTPVQYDNGHFPEYQTNFQNPIFIHSKLAALVMVISILFFPVFDGIRVFILRISKGNSPMKADRQHLHYYLLDAGCNHTQAVLILAGNNIALIILAWALQDMNPYITLGVFFAVTSFIVFIAKRLKMRKQMAPI